ncbi:hypothetical protein HAQ01_05270 [Acidithiobacillus thiooxidans]|uniref:hypothetical protein n=1 Tax=Acidithiobacillus thiooxidans TaxID=930 RepID=UPI001C071F3C|nr:hypothetical protein [Acidithiobacillus thiooxidans]MBU2792804.1 hypothetical protein [Acidithiobacillus thiooxidans]
MIALRAIAPLHHPLNHYAVTGGALRRVPVDSFLSFSDRLMEHSISVSRAAAKPEDLTASSTPEAKNVREALEAMRDAYKKASQLKTLSPIGVFTATTRTNGLDESLDSIFGSPEPEMSAFEKLKNQLANALDNTGIKLMEAGGLGKDTLKSHVDGLVEAVKIFGPEISAIFAKLPRCFDTPEASSRNENSVMHPD